MAKPPPTFKPLAPHVRNAIAGVQAKPAPAARPPAAHLFAALQAKPAALQAKPAALQAKPAALQAKPALPRPAAHVAAAVQAKLQPAPPRWPARPPGVVQRMEEQDPPKEENKRSHLKRKASRGKVYVDKYSQLDDPNYGKNENYEDERRVFDLQQRKKFKKWRKSLGSGELKTIPHYSSGFDSNLNVLSLNLLDQGFESLKGNTESESYAVPIKVGGTEFYFKTSYNMDIGFAPLYLQEESFKAGICRPFSSIADDLDDFVGGDSEWRTEVGRLIRSARDEKGKDWKKKPSKNQETLESLIAELGVIFRLDLMRAGDCKDLARKHQDALLKSSLTFKQLLLQKYIGIKASRLRDPKEYEKSSY